MSLTLSVIEMTYDRTASGSILIASRTTSSVARHSAVCSLSVAPTGRSGRGESSSDWSTASLSCSSISA